MTDSSGAFQLQSSKCFIPSVDSSVASTLTVNGVALKRNNVLLVAGDITVGQTITVDLLTGEVT